MARRQEVSEGDLVDAVSKHYRDGGWTVPQSLTAAEEKLAARLALRPTLVVKRDGMEHLVYPIGRVTDATFKFIERVIFEVNLANEPSHIVLVCYEKVKAAHERRLKEIGVGVILVREEGDPVQLVRPRLCCFHEPDYDHIAGAQRSGVREAVRRIREEDVCVGILDLAQIVEKELKKRLSGTKAKTLGALLGEAKKKQILNAVQGRAGDRVNRHRIGRAHPGSHAKRRRIVRFAQKIVADCTALLFTLP